MKKLPLSFSKAILLCFIFLTALLALPLTSQVRGQSSLGTIDVPPGVDVYIAQSGLSDDEIAIIFFINRGILLITVISALWASLMIILASYTLLTSQGDTGAYTKVKQLFINAVI
ncbi:hypothetical protein KC686_01190, partial [Candidatus Woesebacteria bacterium]|nr:hypothetical protein [Candidatus Woesebacteria bacterium]